MTLKPFVFLNILAICVLSVAIFSLLIAVPLQAQLNPTEQQQTVDAAVQQFFDATATAAAVINPATQTAIFEQTLIAAFQQAQTATAQSQSPLRAPTWTPLPSSAMVTAQPTTPLRAPTWTPLPMQVATSNPITVILNLQPFSVIRGKDIKITGKRLLPNTTYTIILTHHLTNEVRHTTSATTDLDGEFVLTIAMSTTDPIGNYRVQLRQHGVLVIEKEFRLQNPATATPVSESQPGRILTEALRSLRGRGSAFDFTGWKRDVLIDYKAVEVEDNVNYVQWQYVKNKVYEDFVLAGEVQFNNSPMDGACGFVYYDNDTNNTHYIVSLTRNLIFDWGMQIDGLWSPPPYTFTPENTGVYGGARESNEWMILSENGQMVVVVNGGMIAYMVDFSIRSGKVGMSASTPSYTDNNSCIFRNVELWIPG